MVDAQLRIEETPVGPLTLYERDGAIVRLSFGRDDDFEGDGSRGDGGDVTQATPLLKEAQRQLGLYFKGALKDFDLPLKPAGSAFQKSVYNAMAAIPFGQTLTYGEIAKQTNSVPRAVGGACGSNPIPIIIPCHRVLGANGRLTGFSGGEGIATKTILLQLESPQAALL